MTNSPTPEWVLFIGRFHPLLVHLPIGFLLLLALLELLSYTERFKAVVHSRGVVVAASVVGVSASALCGWLLSWDGGYDALALNWHKWTAFGLTGVCLVSAGFYAAAKILMYRLTLVLACVLLFIASHHGGALTHGRGYLTQHAPQPLRAWLGVPAKTNIAAALQPPAQVLVASASPTENVIDLMGRYCTECHGPEKAKGGLRLDSFEAIAKGGDSGPAVVPGQSAASSLIRRMQLPVEHDDHMPPDGKSQPRGEEISILKKWIDAGAPGLK